MHKIAQSGGYLSRPLGPLLKTGSPSCRNVLKVLAKSILNTLGLTAAAAATDAAIHEKMCGFGMMALIISNEETIDIVKITKFLGKFDLLICVIETIKKRSKRTKEWVSQHDKFGTSLFRNLLKGKGIETKKQEEW